MCAWSDWCHTTEQARVDDSPTTWFASGTLRTTPDTRLRLEAPTLMPAGASARHTIFRLIVWVLRPGRYAAAAPVSIALANSASALRAS